MKFSESDFQEVVYGGDQRLFFYKNSDFKTLFGHKRKNRMFLYSKNILNFQKEYPDIKIFFTLDSSVESFEKVEQGFLVNMNAYRLFCKNIQDKTVGRAKAFFGQNISLKNVEYTEDQKNDFIMNNASEKNILDALKNLGEETQKNIINSIENVKEGAGEEGCVVSCNELIDSFSKYLTNESMQYAFVENIPRIQIEILKSHLSFLENNLDKNETFIQNWLDEKKGIFRKQRCLIFGIEYVDPKREGEFMRKRFDILAEQNLDNHVLIELKSPSAEIFRIIQSPTTNDGITTEYHLSPELSRAIPQILQYKKWYENARIEEIQVLGIDKKAIHKCIIIIGTRNIDPLWKENFQMLKSNLNIELLTYTDLIDKMKNTIGNLEENLR